MGAALMSHLLPTHLAHLAEMACFVENIKESPCQGLACFGARFEGCQVCQNAPKAATKAAKVGRDKRLYILTTSSEGCQVCQLSEQHDAPDPCLTVNCFLQPHSAERCRRERCCYAWQADATEHRNQHNRAAAGSPRHPPRTKTHCEARDAGRTNYLRGDLPSSPGRREAALMEVA